MPATKQKTAFSPYHSPLLVVGVSLVLSLFKLIGVRPVVTWGWGWVWSPVWIMALLLLAVGLLIVYFVKRVRRQA